MEHKIISASCEMLDGDDETKKLVITISNLRLDEAAAVALALGNVVAPTLALALSSLEGTKEVSVLPNKGTMQ